MNYIKTLESQKSELLEIKDSIADMITDFMRYLASDKFCGVENNFINASEVFNRLVEIRSNLNKY